jgi:hypothetical protein
MNLTLHDAVMVVLLVIGIVAFFVLAPLYGVDSRPYDLRGRRWM